MTTALPHNEKIAILSGLDSADAEVRRLAVEQLALLPIGEAIDHLAARLGDGEWRVRKAAVERLAQNADDRPVQEMLIDSLSDGDNPGRRNSAIEALVACGSEVTTRLEREVTNPDADVRKLVIDALAAIGSSQSRGPLVEAMADPDANVRAAVVDALAVVGGADEVGALLRASTCPDEDVLVRLSALRALARMEARVSVASLAKPLEEALLRPAALELLGHSEDPAVDDILLKALTHENRSTCEASMAASLRRLSRLDGIEATRLRDRMREVSRAHEELVARSCERLRGADLARRMMLVQFLGLLDDARVVGPILEAGRDEAIEELADSTLECLGPLLPAAIDASWEALDCDSKRRACVVLGRVGGEDSERLLLAALDTSDSELRCASATALGQGGSLARLTDLVRRLEASALLDELDTGEEVETLVDSIVAMAKRFEVSETGADIRLNEILSSRLGGAPEPVRLAVAQVLAHLGREQDQDVIAYLLKDESAVVRRAAVRALARLDFGRSQEPLRLALADESGAVRIAAASVLGEVDDPAIIDDLKQLMRDEDPRVQAVAYRSAGHFYGRTSGNRDEAYALFERGLTGPALAALASLEALDEVGGEAAAGLAAAALARPETEVVRAAVACVGAHGSNECLVELLAHVSHPEWSVRAEVGRVLANRGFRKALPALLRRLELEEDAFVREAILSALRSLEE